MKKLRLRQKRGKKYFAAFLCVLFALVPLGNVVGANSGEAGGGSMLIPQSSGVGQEEKSLLIPSQDASSEEGQGEGGSLLIPSGEGENVLYPQESESNNPLPEESPSPPESSQGGEEASPTSPPAEGGLLQSEEEAASSEFGVFALTPWQTDGVIVETYQEFANALNNNNGYNKIYLGANISGDYTGAPDILVNQNKRDVVVYGRDPRDGQRYSYTSKRSAALGIGLRIGNANIGSFTFEDIDLVGLNMYGICQIYDDAAFRNANFKVTFRNATYSGPQMLYGIDVILRLEDFTYDTTKGLSGIGAYEEVAELRSLELAGDVTINHLMGTDPVFSMFYFRAGVNTDRKITVESGADVTITTDNYFVYTEGHAVEFIVEDGGKIAITARKGCYDTTQYFSKLYVGKGSGFTFIQKPNNSLTIGNVYALRINGALTVEEGAQFRVERTTGDGISYSLIHLGSNSASVAFNNPAHVFIYSPTRTIMNFSVTGRPVHISADTINVWHNSADNENDSINNMPTAIWNKNETSEPVVFDLTFTLYGALNSATTNLDSSDPVVELPDSTNLHPSSMRLLTMGDFTLTGDIKNTGAVGATEPNADMTFTYGSPLVTVPGKADDKGAYQILPSGGSEVPLNEKPIVLSHSNYLKARLIKETIDDIDKTLRFEHVPPLLDFGTTTIQATQQQLSRMDPNWYIEVYDGRGAGSTWWIGAITGGPLTSGSGDTLPNALVMTLGGSSAPLSPVEQLIWNGVTAGAANTPGAITRVSWAADEGPLVVLAPGMGMVGESYKTTITWTLYDAP